MKEAWNPLEFKTTLLAFFVLELNQSVVEHEVIQEIVILPIVLTIIPIAIQIHVIVSEEIEQSFDCS